MPLRRAELAFEDPAAITADDGELLDSVRAENDVPTELVMKLLDIKRASHGLKQRHAVHTRIGEAFALDWRDVDTLVAGVSQLFFFDGEKFAEIAGDDIDEGLAEAVRGPLGIELVGRLRTDLELFMARRSRNDDAATATRPKPQGANTARRQPSSLCLNMW